MAERDDAVSRRYRELPAEEPPRALDEAILYASRRAVDARPAPLVAPTGRQRWYVPLAAAAVIVLAVGLTLRVQLEQPAEVTEEVTPASPTVLKDSASKERTEEKKPPPERRARQMTAAPSSRPEAPAPFPGERAAREAPAEPSADTRSAEAQSMRGSVGVGAEPPAAAAAAPSLAAPPPLAVKPAPQAAPRVQMRAVPAQAPRADDAARDHTDRALASGATAKQGMQEAPETPEKMLERIAELRKVGKDDEADKALAEFRKRYPGYTLSEEMRAKVERAKAAAPAR